MKINRFKYKKMAIINTFSIKHDGSQLDVDITSSNKCKFIGPMTIFNVENPLKTLTWNPIQYPFSTTTVENGEVDENGYFYIGGHSCTGYNMTIQGDKYDPEAEGSTAAIFVDMIYKSGGYFAFLNDVDFISSMKITEGSYLYKEVVNSRIRIRGFIPLPHGTRTIRFTRDADYDNTEAYTESFFYDLFPTPSHIQIPFSLIGSGLNSTNISATIDEYNEDVFNSTKTLKTSTVTMFDSSYQCLAVNEILEIFQRINETGDGFDDIYASDLKKINRLNAMIVGIDLAQSVNMISARNRLVLYLKKWLGYE